MKRSVAEFMQVFLVRVQSSRSLSHLLMSFLSLHGQVAYNFMAMDVAYCILDMVYKAAWEDVGYSGVRVYMK